MKFIIAKKLEMSQRYRSTGEVVPVTLVKAEPCTVTQVKTADKDGYVAVQIGSGTRKHVNKPLAGHLGAHGPLAMLREFRTKEAEDLQPGMRCDVSAFAEGDTVQVVGQSKGKGFQGVVKRHGFAGSKATHGNKDQLRMPGSIGATGAQRVFPGTRMGGRMGGERVTVKNLEIVEIDAEGGQIAIKGAVPGARGSLLLISGDGEMTWLEEKVEDEAQSPEGGAESAESEESSSEETPEAVAEEEKAEEAPAEESEETPAEEKKAE